jgi:hypothetical protein
MNRGRVGEERGGKEMDGCPLTVAKTCSSSSSKHITRIDLKCK